MDYMFLILFFINFIIIGILSVLYKIYLLLIEYMYIGFEKVNMYLILYFWILN